MPVVSTEVPAGPRGQYLALQRTALWWYLQLSRGVADVEDARVDKAHATRRDRSDRGYRAMLDTLDRQHRESTAKADHDHAAHLQYVRHEYGEQIEALQAEYERRCVRVNEETEAGLRDATKTMEQDAWLAESVFEAAKTQIERDREKFERTVPNLKRRLDQVRARVDWVLDELQYTPSDPEPIVDSNRLPRPADDTHTGDFVERVYDRTVELLGELENLSTPMFERMGSALGIGAARRRTQSRIESIAVPLRHTLERAYLAVDEHVQAERARFEQAHAEAVQRRDVETRRAQKHRDEMAADLKVRRKASLAKLEDTLENATGELKRHRDQEIERLESAHRAGRDQARETYDRLSARLAARRDRELERIDRQHQAARRDLEARWAEGIDSIKRLLAEGARLNSLAPDWSDACWRNFTPDRAFVPDIRFGHVEVDLSKLADCVTARTGFDPRREAGHAGDAGVATGSIVHSPTVLELPQRCSLLVQTAQQGRGTAVAALQSVMARLLTSLPPGRAHFTIIDPVGLGESFAGFMHLADYDEALIGGRIWTEKQQIEQRLGDLTAHMENVIQKYLRNEFETIDAYNVQAGELAEPYRFLVIADFPTNFTEEAVRRLGAIVSSGARCGVYTLIAHDTRHSLPFGIQMEDVQSASLYVRHDDGRFVWQDDVLSKFKLELEAPPEHETLTGLMHKVGQAAGRAKRVEVPFEFITPSTEQTWSASSAKEIRVPVGRTGAVRLQELRLGRGVAQHALIAGKTGSGKSTLLHVLITNLVLWYSPDEVEFYLIDFKKGVEFKTYATHALPHARAIAIESDREFGLSVLQRIDAEMQRRGDLFRDAGVQDLPGYRDATGKSMPRTLLIVDEFQVFFAEEDKIAQDAAILLDRIVRQGRAFGIHVILGSQTLGGTAGLARSTIGQMAVRIALQCSEIDSQMILDDGNSAARLLSRPGEAIYNDAGGLLQGNSPFQTAWLSDEERDVFLDRVTGMSADRPRQDGESLIVFEGNAAADLRRNRLLQRFLEARAASATSSPNSTFNIQHSTFSFYLGEAVAIKDPTAATFQRQSGSNLLLIGQRDDASLAILAAGIISLAAQHDASAAEFVVLDGSSAESPHILQKVAGILPHRSRFPEYRTVADTVNEIAGELKRRQENDISDAPAIYVFIYGLQRYRMLRKSEDFSFSFGTTGEDENAPPATDKQFAEILREGPTVGIHVIAWADTPATIERTLDRASLREFDNRVLFQMSASDSSNLIDSPIANRLGFYRALFYSEEQGLLEKFRPYSLPDQPYLDELRRLFATP